MYYSKKLKKFKTIKHCFFSRKGGYSNGFYESLNCGIGSNDKKKNVLKNLNFISRKMQIRKVKLILMNQTHSSKVLEIKNSNVSKRINSDSIITKKRGIALGVLTADCVPILVYDKKNNIIGSIHAGWKGAFSGIIKNTILKIKKLNSKTEIFASIGPCIGQKSYEVDTKFYRKFILKSKRNKIYFKRKSKYKRFFNLRKFVADKLKELKVKIDHVNYDTFRERKHFFSYRRSLSLRQADYGRCISVIRLV
tara:strand:- start:4048 stop:4800 length:753 start_codon:yes stop_codon:yes gene_type:complete